MTPESLNNQPYKMSGDKSMSLDFGNDESF